MILKPLLFYVICMSCVARLGGIQEKGATIFRTVSPSIVAIHTFDARGRGLSQASAFVADSGSVVVTNAMPTSSTVA